MTGRRPEKSPKNPTPNETSPRVADEARLPEELLALFSPGDLVERLPGHGPLLPLNLRTDGTGLSAPSGWTRTPSEIRRFSDWTERDVPRCWLVLNARWEPDLCHLWIELISMDGTLRGWLKDPQVHVRKIQLAAPVL